MKEVLEHPESVPLWIDAFEGRPDREATFEGCNSTIDAPGCRFWRELSAYDLEAKVLHSVRDPDSWFESTQKSVFAPDSRGLNPTPPFARFFAHSLRPIRRDP
jgi:hypothetical protein